MQEMTDVLMNLGQDMTHEKVFASCVASCVVLWNSTASLHYFALTNSRLTAAGI